MTFAVVLLLVGLGLSAFAIVQHRDTRRFRARAVRVDLRVASVSERTMAGVRGVKTFYYIPRFVVASGDHLGRRANGSRSNTRRHTIGGIYPGWFDPERGEVHTDLSIAETGGFPWAISTLGFLLLCGGVAALFTTL